MEQCFHEQVHVFFVSGTHTRTHMHGREHADSAIHIPAVGFMLLTVGGSSVQRQAVTWKTTAVS